MNHFDTLLRSKGQCVYGRSVSGSLPQGKKLVS
jgi:hypothetical protein